MRRTLAIDLVHEDCVRWVEDNGDQSDAVGHIAKTKLSSIQALVQDAIDRQDEDDYETYVIEYAALNWVLNVQDNKKLKMKPRSKNNPEFRFRTHTALNLFLKYLRSMLKVSKMGKPLPEWANQALLEGWKPPPSWTP